MLTFHMEQQNLLEGWNLVFELLFHTYSSRGPATRAVQEW